MKVTISKPSAIILDIMSTAIKAGFIEKGLFAYVRKNGLKYIEQNWSKKEFKDLVTGIRRQVRRDTRTCEQTPQLSDKDSKEAVEVQSLALFNNVIWYMDQKKETSAHYKFKFAIYEEGYENGGLKTHVYTDVAKNVKIWHELGIKIYIYSNAWIKSQQMFLKKTNHGSLFEMITGFFDTSDIGLPTDPNSFTKLIQQIAIPAGDCVFLTKGIEEGKAAKVAGVHSILVISHQHQLKRYGASDLEQFARLRSFDELLFSENANEVTSTAEGVVAADGGGGGGGGEAAAGATEQPTDNAEEADGGQ